MAKNLVIVESPAKSKTIKKYLGDDFEILASYGHIRDLEPKESSVDVNDHFKMKYQLIECNKCHIDAIKKSAKSAQEIYLATDPDREGEAISWHIHEILNDAKLLKNKIVHRIAFNEITKSAVKSAVANPRKLAMDLVDAQQARRALDFLVGFKLSPLLWKKVRCGLSAGRVQSPALRMIVERDLEIKAFDSREYWSITAKLKKNKNFTAKLTEFNQQKCEQFSFSNENDTNKVLEIIKKDANGELIVNNIEKKQKRRNPLPPFITSTLQQEAVKKLGFTTKKVMVLAQQLYEGIELGSEGSIGLITYMRTDSTNLSQEALTEIRDFITKEHGQDYLPSKERIYKTKNQNAQEAHEAIRPTSAWHKPQDIKVFLSTDQFNLYDLIWKRTIACQMIHALMHTVTIDFIKKSKYKFKATGSVVGKYGFLAVYQEAKDEDDISDDSEGLTLPEFNQGEKVPVLEIFSKQHFTEPPPCYTEASLVKVLEEYGIGRPSTYATIISTLQQRGYAVLEKKRFNPTDVGSIVNSFLTTYFQRYVEYNFTAKLENELDNIANGKVQWIPVLEKFWQPFIQQITEIDATVKKRDVTHEKMDENCLECGHKLSIRLGRSGRFIGCTNYPACTYTRAIAKDVNQKPEEKLEKELVTDHKCPECESELLIKQGRYGKFIGCSNYPKCKHIESLEKPKDMGAQCPKCKKNNFVEKKSRKGKLFYACSGFPKCKNSFWYPPIIEECTKCHSPILLHKTTKKEGEQKVCPNNTCDYVVNLSAFK